MKRPKPPEKPEKPRRPPPRPFGHQAAEQEIQLDADRWSAFKDSFGEREHGIDADGSPIELLRLIRDFSPVDGAIAERVTKLKRVDLTAVGRSYRVENDDDKRRPRSVLVSERIPGVRLSEIIARGSSKGVVPDIGASLYVMRRLYAAAQKLRKVSGLDHFILAPERVVVTPRGELVIVEVALAAGADALAAAGSIPKSLKLAYIESSSKKHALRLDIARVARIGVAMLVGRAIDASETIDALSPILGELNDVAAIRAGDAFSAALRTWLEQALTIEAGVSFEDFAAASAALDQTNPPKDCVASRETFRAYLESVAIDELSQGDLPAIEVERLRGIRTRQTMSRSGQRRGWTNKVAGELGLPHKDEVLQESPAEIAAKPLNPPRPPAAAPPPPPAPRADVSKPPAPAPAPVAAVETGEPLKDSVIKAVASRFGFLLDEKKAGTSAPQPAMSAAPSGADVPQAGAGAPASELVIEHTSMTEPPVVLSRGEPAASSPALKALSQMEIPQAAPAWEPPSPPIEPPAPETASTGIVEGMDAVGDVPVEEPLKRPKKSWFRSVAKQFGLSETQEASAADSVPTQQEPHLSAEEEARRYEAERFAAADAERAAESARRLSIEQEARRTAEEAVKRLAAEVEAQRKAEDEARRMAADASARQRAAEEEARRAAEEEARRLAAEAEAKRKIEEEARRVAAEAEARRVAEAEARRLAAEAEARRKAEEEARRLAAEAEARRKAEEEARRKAEEEARRKAEAEARRKAEEEARRLAAEAEARRKAEEEARRLAVELEARRKAEEEARRLAAEIEARRKAEEEARRLAAEAEAKRAAAEAEARRLAAEAESRRQAAEAEARRAAEERARLEEQARRAAAEEAARLAAQAAEEEGLEEEIDEEPDEETSREAWLKSVAAEMGLRPDPDKSPASSAPAWDHATPPVGMKRPQEWQPPPPPVQYTPANAPAPPRQPVEATPRQVTLPPPPPPMQPPTFPWQTPTVAPPPPRGEPVPLHTMTPSVRYEDEAIEEAAPSRLEAVRSGSGWLRLVAMLVVVLGLGAGGYWYWANSVNPGVVSVDSNPSGAEVFVDGQSRGMTPLTLSLSPGTHALELRRRGATRGISLDVKAGEQISQQIDLSNIRAVGTLVVNSEPKGAKVIVDGKELGVTPFTRNDMSVGPHKVVLQSAQGVITKDIQIQAGGTVNVDEGIFSGWIRVFGPFDLKVYEGRRQIGSTEQERIMIPAGRHELTFVNEQRGFRDTRTVDVGPGATLPISIDKTEGTLRVDAPEGSEISIDGTRVGEAPLGEQTVTLGVREVSVKHPELGEKKMSVTVTSAAPADVKVEFTP